ncbi:MAG: helix-turn-helix domain-containing protein [Oscillospiraceae bacterium]|nr:helix-turn-helix domain-containing protein [Oscillospiraceae bacterium]
MRLLTLDGKYNICGDRVRIARENQNLSQEALAARIQLNGHSLTQKAISRIETGLRVVPDYEIPLLADALKVNPLWLLGLDC